MFYMYKLDNHKVKPYLRIKRCKVKHATQEYVFFGGSKVYRKTSAYEYFDTWEQARRKQVKLQKQYISSIESLLAKAKKQLTDIKKQKKTEDTYARTNSYYRSSEVQEAAI